MHQSISTYNYLLFIVLSFAVLWAQTPEIDDSTADTNYIIHYDSLVTQGETDTSISNSNIRSESDDVSTGVSSISKSEYQRLMAEAKKQDYSDPEYTLTQLNEKRASFKKMKESGTALLVMGLMSLPTGIILYANGKGDLRNNPFDPFSDNSGERESAQRRVRVGFIFTAIGIPLTVAGSVLTGIGSGKYREYIRRHKLATEGMVSIKVTGNSVNFAFKF